MSSEKYGDERRLALVIGVNEAPQSHLPPLNYALNDARVYGTDIAGALRVYIAPTTSGGKRGHQRKRQEGGAGPGT